MIAYFTGVRPGDANGHFCHVPGYKWASHTAPRSPWAGERALVPLADNGVCGPATWPELYRPGTHYGLTKLGAEEPEGRARTARKDGWTLLFLWDRSADRRGGCSASFAFDQDLDDHAVLETARKHFPEVFERIEKHLGRQVVLDVEKYVHTHRVPNSFEERIEELMRGHIGPNRGDILHQPVARNPVPLEIARRIAANAELVSIEQLRDQILIVLADYRNHAWTYGQLKGEATRIHLAGRIMDLVADLTTEGT